MQEFEPIGTHWEFTQILVYGLQTKSSPHSWGLFDKQAPLEQYWFVGHLIFKQEFEPIGTHLKFTQILVKVLQ